MTTEPEYTERTATTDDGLILWNVSGLGSHDVILVLAHTEGDAVKAARKYFDKAFPWWHLEPTIEFKAAPEIFYDGVIYVEGEY